MSREKILVPLGPDSKDLKAVTHALALANRVNAIVYVLYFNSGQGKSDNPGYINDTCLELVNSACEEGLTVYYHIAEDDFEERLSDAIDNKDIDLIVISNTESRIDRIVRRMLPNISCQVIQVKEKNDINYLQ